MSNVAIRVEHLGKRYRISERQAPYKTLRDTLAGVTTLFQRRHHNGVAAEAAFWVLKDVSFEVKRGEVLGIVGRNGAGKSTLLKILSRITEPTMGRAEIHGRIGSLLEVGTGFHPELTGRENIYLNGAVLGMHRVEIDRKFDDIVGFAEIEQFLDTPVKHYSSGMYTRLAFAVAAHLEPEILIVDEVLAVGDAAFQRKCLGKMSEVAREGRTVLFVSHSMAAIHSLCTAAMLLEHGSLMLYSTPTEVIQRYLSHANLSSTSLAFDGHSREGNGQARIIAFRLLDSNGKPTSDVPMGTTVTFEIDVNFHTRLSHVDFQIGVYTHLMQNVCHFSSRTSGFVSPPLGNRAIISCTVPNLTLTSGTYFLNFALYHSSSGDCYDRLVGAASFNVVERDVFGSGRIPNPAAGSCYFPVTWDITS